MKKLIHIIASAAALSSAFAAHAAEERDASPLPMPTYGFNLGNTLESTWGYPQPTEAIFTTAAESGFNAVRVPCAWNFNADPNTYQIDPDYMAEVKQVVDWSIAAGMHVMINIHWDGGWMENNIGTSVDPIIDEKLASYWTQIATAFADYDNRLLFAAANEPNAHNPAEMATLLAYYQTFVNAVRAVGGKNANRWLVLQGGGDVSWLNSLPQDSTPNRLMLEYHNYTPSLFTIIHDDQSWGDTIYFWGEAYHYPGNPSRNATWGQEGAIDAGFQQLVDRYVSRGIPVLVGEFQAAGKSYLTGEERAYNDASRLYWNKYLVDSAQAHGLSPFYWSTPDSPFEYSTGAIVDQEIVTVLTGGSAPPPPNGAPYAATGLTAAANGNGEIALSWNPVDGATHYQLYRSANSGYQPATPAANDITGTSYNDTGLNDGTTYYYKVVALNESGRSGYSAEAPATTPGDNPDPSQFHFENDPQAWIANGNEISGIAVSSEQSFAGNHSLAVNFGGSSAGSPSLETSDVPAPPGSTITFNVWIPAGSQVSQLQLYLQDYDWNSTTSTYTDLSADAWNTVTLTIPTNAITPLKRLGIRFTTSAAWTGACYLDAIDWHTLSAPPTPAGLASVSGSSEITLNWSPSANASAYQVMRSIKSASDYTTLTTTDATSYTDSGLEVGEAFYYIVIATNDSGESRAPAPVLAKTYASIEDWRLEHFDTTDNSGDAADSADPDGDSSTNWQEYIAGTDPKNRASYLKIEMPTASGNSTIIRFPSVLERTYRVERSGSLTESSWVTVKDNIAGTGSTIQLTDTIENTHTERFYRLVATR